MQIKTAQSPMRPSIKDQQACLVQALRQSSISRHLHLADKLEKCGTPRRWKDKLTGEVREQPDHCDRRICPRCQLRKQRRLVRESQKWIEPLVRSDTLEFKFVTIGLLNVPVTYASYEHARIKNGFSRSHRRKGWPGVGTSTSFEFTISKDRSIHFNTHSLIAVPAKHCVRGSLACEIELQELLHASLRLSYSPQIDIQPLRGNDTRGRMANFMRAFKYMVKPQDYAADAEVGIMLADQLHGLRRLSFTGIFKDTKSKCNNSG